MRFSAFALFTLLYNLAVILWGAFVRASGSGDGCGPHWPLCHNQVIPSFHETQTLVEFAHRASSGFCLVFAVAVYLYARKTFPTASMPRTAAGWQLVLTIIEAGIGAVLVLLSLVDQNDSIWRVVVVGAHLLNTFLLIGAGALCAWTAFFQQHQCHTTFRQFLRHPLTVGLLGLAATAILGAMAAVGDLLYPSSSLSEGIARDFSANSPLFIRLRITHPIVALCTAAYIGFFALGSCLNPSSSQRVRWLARGLLTGLCLQLLIGLTTVALLAPLSLQLLHLLCADLLWICTMLLLWEERYSGVSPPDSLSEKT